jgi:hypothetical protein
MSKKSQESKEIEKNKINDLGSTLDKFYQETVNPENIFQALGVALIPISLWNPQIGALLQTFISTMNIGINIHSQRKAEKRLMMIIETIYKIWKKQQDGETNFEAALICPELFRNAIIFEDDERAKEHLILIEALFSSQKMDFDDLAEALRIVNQLSCMEYKILKLIPQTDTKWADLLSRNEFETLFETQEKQLTAAFLSLINMNLVVRKLAIKHDGGPELGTINYNDKLEFIRLSAYGQLFLETLQAIKMGKNQ